MVHRVVRSESGFDWIVMHATNGPVASFATRAEAEWYAAVWNGIDEEPFDIVDEADLA